VTAHPHEPHENEADCSGSVSRRDGRVRRAFKPVVQVGWNIAALIFGGRIQEARDIALFNDHEAGLAYMRKHHKEVKAKVEEMLSYPH
jgi:hypothetical protein